MSSFLLFITVLSLFIAITLDDHPMPNGTIFSINERIERFCKTFEKHGCKGAFFCIGSFCTKSENLKPLNDQGHFLANHSFNHPHLSSITIEEFKREIGATENRLAPYSQFRKWFRYPYLDYGNRVDLGGTEEKYLSSMELLKTLDYKEGFVTINTFDWHINACLQRAIKGKQHVDYVKLKEVYLSLLNEWCRHYIACYKELFDEEIIHVLLLHANDLNALYLDDILHMIKENGWDLISPENVFNNPSWRGVLLNRKELIPKNPPSLNCPSIDAQLESASVFLFRG